MTWKVEAAVSGALGWMKAAVNRELRRRGQPVSSESEEEDEDVPLLGGAQQSSDRACILGTEWLQSSNNRSAACALAGAASAVAFAALGYPHLAVKCCVCLLLLSLFLGLPKSDEDQEAEDRVLQRLEERNRM